jgi:hypothetical protein
MKLISRISALAILVGLAAIPLAAGRGDCKDTCKSIFTRDRNICDQAYKSNNDVTKYRDCLDRAKTTYDNCMAACK